MTAVSQVIGRTAADRVRFELMKPGGTPPSKRSVLVRTLDRDEVEHLVATIERLQVEESTDAVEIVVSMSTARKSADPVLGRFASDHPLTWFRSRVNRGLVLIELDPFSDAAGMRHQLTISDRELMGSSDVRRSRDELLRHAWALSRSAGGEPPQLLTERLEDLAQAFLATEVALRPWAGFLVNLIERLPVDEVLTSEKAHALISESLPALGLFRDPELFTHRNLEKEVGQNRHLAQLRDTAGRELEQEDWLKRIETATFAVHGESRDDASEENRREAARDYILARTSEHRAIAPTYRQWSSIFEARAKRGLGEQIRSALEQLNSAALEHFEELGLSADLDNKDREAAQALVDDDADVGESKTVLELVPPVLRRRIERLAEPDTTVVEDPLRGLLRAVMSLAGEQGVEISLRPLDPVPPSSTARLFALLYGPTLSWVAEASAGRLKLADALLEVGELPVTSMTGDGADDEAEQVSEQWADLRLEIVTGDGESGLNLSWAPRHRDGLALLARTIAAPGAPWPLTGEDFESILGSALTTGLAEPEDDAPGVEDAAGVWSRTRGGFLNGFSRGGLDPDQMYRYADAWEEHAARLAEDVHAHPELRAESVGPFLDTDLFRNEEGNEIWMLASHPLRLRWLADDLTHLRRHLVDALCGGLELNPENSSLFFEWLDRVSPHRQPPMLCSSDRTFLAAQELGLHEQYLRSEVNRTAIGEQMDAKTASEVTSIVSTYLEAFPSKVDRFVLLVLTQAGDSNLVEQVLHRLLVDRKTSNPRQTVELHLVAPAAHHRRLAAAVSGIEIESSSARLFPRLRTLLHAWPAAGLPPLQDLVGSVDIAVVPEVLGSSATLNDSTGAPSRTGHKFNAWLDKPVHVPLESRHHTDVTIELLPESEDRPLELWSTLNVWRRRQPVGTEPTDVDRVSLAVDVKRGLKLFHQLHDVAQWVVTVDEFVGREQIDAIEDPPDVILVRPGRGKNEQYTLVVSSRAGRQFVERGLARKLERLELGLDPESSRALPGRLYELARNTAPSVVLRAIGLGRTLEEILGLVTTRVLVEQALPSEPGVGADWWISLDDHAEWFGGASKTRADLARIALRREGEHSRLTVDVVESKFRKSDDSRQAVRQVARTVRILEAGLDVGQDRADSRFWREEIARAIDGVSRRRAESDELPGFRTSGNADDSDLDMLRASLREGTYDLEIRGIACSIAVRAQGPLERTLDGEVIVIKAPQETAQEVLRGLASESGVPRFPALQAKNEPEVARSQPEPATKEGADPPTKDLISDADGDPAVSSTDPDEADENMPRETGQAEVTDPDHSGSKPGERLPDAELRRRLQLVVDKLDELRVPVGVPESASFDEGPGFYLLRVKPGHGVKVQQIQQRIDDLKLALGLETDQALRTYTHRGSVVFEVPKDDAERYGVEAEQLWRRIPPDPKRLVLPVGEDISGAPVSLDLSSPDSPHLLVAGMTGSGKSVALETLLKGAARYAPADLRVLAVDPKRTELTFLEDGPHLLGQVGLTPAEASEILERATSEMERRYELMAAARVSKIVDYNDIHDGEHLPWWIVVLDEYADLAIDAEDRKLVEPKMLRLAQKARAAGIHLILATQRPSADILNTSVRANFPAQLALRVRSVTESQIIIGEAGAEALAGKGDALLRTSSGLTRLQCAVVSD